jgi:hypothetical protein
MADSGRDETGEYRQAIIEEIVRERLAQQEEERRRSLVNANGEPYKDLLPDMLDAGVFDRQKYAKLKGESERNLARIIRNRDLMELAIKWGVVESAAQFWARHKTQEDLLRRVREEKADRILRDEETGRMQYEQLVAEEELQARRADSRLSPEDKYRARSSSLAMMKDKINLPEYKGDMFGTRGEYMHGILYASRRMSLHHPNSPVSSPMHRSPSMPEMGYSPDGARPGEGLEQHSLSALPEAHKSLFNDEVRTWKGPANLAREDEEGVDEENLGSKSAFEPFERSLEDVEQDAHDEQPTDGMSSVGVAPVRRSPRNSQIHLHIPAHLDEEIVALASGGTAVASPSASVHRSPRPTSSRFSPQDGFGNPDLPNAAHDVDTYEGDGVMSLSDFVKRNVSELDFILGPRRDEGREAVRKAVLRDELQCTVSDTGLISFPRRATQKMFATERTFMQAKGDEEENEDISKRRLHRVELFNTPLVKQARTVLTLESPEVGSSLDVARRRYEEMKSKF